MVKNQPTMVNQKKLGSAPHTPNIFFLTLIVALRKCCNTMGKTVSLDIQMAMAKLWIRHLHFGIACIHVGVKISIETPWMVSTVCFSNVAWTDHRIERIRLKQDDNLGWKSRNLTSIATCPTSCSLKPIGGLWLVPHAADQMQDWNKINFSCCSWSSPRPWTHSGQIRT